MTVTAERTFDAGLVKSILTIPQIWMAITEDDVEPADFEPDMNGELWILLKAEGEPVAIFNLHSHNRTTAEIHAHVIPEHRKQYSKAAGTAALQFIYMNYPVIQKINAIIPVIYKNVRYYTEGFGFKLEGIDRLSYTKDGNVINRWTLGITRDEIRGYLRGESI